jgi:hypothetical protein
MRPLFNHTQPEVSVKVVKKTDEYTIYEKRSGRLAIKDANKNWINGEDKVKILVEEKLLEVKLPEPAPEEPEAEETAAEETADTAEEEAAPEAEGEETAEEES